MRRPVMLHSMPMPGEGQDQTQAVYDVCPSLAMDICVPYCFLCISHVVTVITSAI